VKLLCGDADFVGTLRAVLTMQPRMSDSRFQAWFGELEGKERLAGGVGATVVERVPRAQLAAFQARRDAEPDFRAVVGGTPVAPVAAAGRASYCLLSASVSILGGLSRELAGVLQGDWCLPSSPIGKSQGPLLRADTETGQVLVLPVTAQGIRTIIFQTAFYRRGARLATPAQRAAAVQGWLASTFDIPAVMDLALGTHRGLSLTLYHSNPGGRVELIGHTGSALTAGRLSYARSLTVGGSWKVAIAGTLPAAGLSADWQGALVLLVGTVVTLLLCALIRVLARSRERALAMVRQKTAQLRHQALHDGLTCLPNRVLALDRARQMLARARRNHVPVAALYVDLDGFKHVNDTFGHAAGDLLLRIVAERLRDVIRDVDTAARLGGDEFVVLLEDATAESGPRLVAHRLLESLRRPYDLGEEYGQRSFVTASIGIAIGDRDTADELLRDADIALYEAKSSGRNRYVTFERGMQTASKERLTLEMDLAEAVEEEQLFLLYQPTFDLNTERVVGVEALIRWEHPTRGLIAPDGFIPLAEQSGLIIPIGRWVLGEACRQAALWHAGGHRIGVAVNVSARQLDDDDLIEDVRDALATSRLAAGALTLEITETALMRDCEATARRLVALKQLGVRIAIDDFGTGYSSLAYLSQFPADCLKIDRSFVANISSSEAATALIHTFVQLGRALGVETLAEGIEDREQLETLQREHCDQGQGFLFSPPLDVAAIERFLEHAPAGSRSLSLL
jgi:diguanylate cyclase (GGDEF)-like protein